jgi:hypothetical protein
MLAFLTWASANRQLLIALALVLLCWWLLRPKTPPNVSDESGAASGRSTNPKASMPRKRAVSISTPGTLLRFRAGVPEVDDSAVTALLALCAVAEVHLITKLETDSDAQV